LQKQIICNYKQRFLRTHLCRLPYPSVSRPIESPTTMPGITITKTGKSFSILYYYIHRHCQFRLTPQPQSTKLKYEHIYQVIIIVLQHTAHLYVFYIFSCEFITYDKTLLYCTILHSIKCQQNDNQLFFYKQTRMLAIHVTIPNMTVALLFAASTTAVQAVTLRTTIVK